MSRLLALLVAFALLVPAPAALAQSGGGAFGPLPPAQPAETPEPEEQENTASPDEDVSRSTMFLVAVGVLFAFFALGWGITRDARRNLTEADRAAVEGIKTGEPIRKQDRAKARERARQKTRAQRQARKKTRRAGR
jgi:hypothetical protein